MRRSLVCWIARCVAGGDRQHAIGQVKQLDDTGVFESPYWVESSEPAKE